MDVVIDGIIYQLQSCGGISRMFSEILPRMCDLDESLNITLLSSGPFLQTPPTHPHIHSRSVSSAERALSPDRPPGPFASVPISIEHRLQLIRLWNTFTLPAREMAGFLSLRSMRGAIWHSTYYTTPYGLSRHKWDGPMVTTVHDTIHEMFPQHFPEHRSFHERKRRCIEKADLVIAVSENTKRDVLQRFRIGEHRIRVIHNAASTVFTQASVAQQEELVRRLGLAKPFVLYVGCRSGYKNFSVLLEAYSIWEKRHDLDLICVGGEAAWSAEETQTMIRANLTSSVKLFTEVTDEDLRGLYSRACMFVYPSLYEGLGLPPLEAMACGTPVVVANSSSLPEVVGNAGLYFEPSAHEELLDAIDRVAEDTDLRQALTRKGFERAGMFTWEKTAAETYDAYRNVL
ncbi:MAG: glycosyltransferase family 1 protein [Chloroflexi bacterium]|nr:glycosyltransferase family 1 protein [Chloroflexota bacterium]